MVKLSPCERISNDLAEAKIPSRFANIVDVKRHNSEEIAFTYVSESLPQGQVSIQALILGVHFLFLVSSLLVLTSPRNRRIP
jgi:hypothetical protein